MAGLIGGAHDDLATAVNKRDYLKRRLSGTSDIVKYRELERQLARVEVVIDKLTVEVEAES